MKPSVHHTNFMQSVMAYIKRVYIMQGLLYGRLNQCSSLYINCTTLKLVVHISTTV